MNRTLPNYIVPPITPEYGGLKDRHEALRHYFVHLFLPSLSNYLNTAADIISTGTQGVGRDPNRTLPSNPSITISSYIHHISGTGTITTINIPGAGSDSVRVGTSINFQAGLVLISDAGFSLASGDNIASSLFVPVNTCCFVVFDGYLWYPILSAFGGSGADTTPPIQSNGQMFFTEQVLGPKDSANVVFTSQRPILLDGHSKPMATLWWKDGRQLYVSGAPDYGQWTFAFPKQITMGVPPDAGDDLVLDPVVYV